MPEGFLFAGGHSASFRGRRRFWHTRATALDCVVCGEGEGIVPQLLEAAGNDRDRLARAAGDRDPPGARPARRRLIDNLDAIQPARDLLRRRRRYFLGAVRSVRVGRVFAGMPLGLHVLQRLDVLRPHLSPGRRRGGGREPGPNARAGRVHRRRRGDARSRARPCDRRRDRAPQDSQGVLSGDAERLGAAPPGSFSALAWAGAAIHVPGAGGARRRRVAAIPQADDHRRRLSGVGGRPRGWGSPWR